MQAVRLHLSECIMKSFKLSILPQARQQYCTQVEMHSSGQLETKLANRQAERCQAFPLPSPKADAHQGDSQPFCCHGKSGQLSSSHSKQQGLHA